MVLDFDDVVDIEVLAGTLIEKEYVYALWLSPRANGLKCLVKIADGKKHRLHFDAIRDIFPDVDKSGVNESRVCYESYDPNIYINPNAKPFTKTKEVTQYQAKEALTDDFVKFKNLLKWLTNKGSSFTTGERNNYIFKLAGACCRFGIHEDNAAMLIMTEYPSSNDFTHKEAGNTIRSAYKKNNNQFGSCQFERDILVDKTSRKEVEIPVELYDDDAPPRDVIYGAHVKANALNLYNNGYEKVSGINVPMLDALYKCKRGELTGLTGIGNYGKSAWNKWYKLMRILLYGEKFASFSPEDNPPEEYYHDFVEMLLGCDCTPSNTFNRPSIETYSNAYDFVSKHMFYLSPKDNDATMEYIKERFLELIIKEKVSGCTIDPWNQVQHDYSGHGANVAKYLEKQLGGLARFAQQNDVYMDLVVHPKVMQKDKTQNYECPDIFDLNDGAMWNNKLDNLLVYHRPFAQTDPSNPTCNFHSKKIKRQKIVGKKGMLEAEYKNRTRRFEFAGIDHMGDVLRMNDLCFTKPVIDYKPKTIPDPPNERLSTFYAAFQPPRLPSESIAASYNRMVGDNKNDEDVPF